METTLAIDCSNYTGAITEEQAAGLYAAGVRRAIVQAVNPERAFVSLPDGSQVLSHRQQVPVLRAAGIEVEGYVYVWFSAGADWAANTRVRWACEEFKALGVNMVWLDCEQSDHDDPPFDYVHMPVTPIIDAGIDVVRAHGMDVGIYTAAWWWLPAAAGPNSDKYSKAGIPLWDAYYDLDPDIDPVNYGGWNVPRMSQYKGVDANIAGVTMIDLNSYEAVSGAITPVEPVLSPEPSVVKLVYAIFSGRVMRLPELDGKWRYEVRLEKE